MIEEIENSNTIKRNEIFVELYKDKKNRGKYIALANPVCKCFEDYYSLVARGNDPLELAEKYKDTLITFIQKNPGYLILPGHF